MMKSEDEEECGGKMGSERGRDASEGAKKMKSRSGDGSGRERKGREKGKGQY